MTRHGTGARMQWAATVILALSTTLGIAPAAQGATPTATMVRSIPRVGAIFFPSVLGSSVRLGLPHECSASVVHSPNHDLVLTAAHCIVGNGIGYDFVPGYHDGLAPFGIWSARHVYVDPAWIRSQDPQHDYAFLEMAPTFWRGALRRVEDVVGAYVLGTAPAAGTRVTVDGYVAGVNDRPITCTQTVYDTAGYPTFDCAGFANGTSGGPWLRGPYVVGAIGGLHQGGCTPVTSYTSAFGPDILADWQRAASHATPDWVPIAGPDGC